MKGDGNLIQNRFFDTDINLQNEIVQLIIDSKLIPIIGSGFTRKCASKNGEVPSGQDMQNYVKSVLAKVYGKNEKEYDKYSFPELCTMFDKRSSAEEKYSYFSNNFTGVKLSQIKSEFLALNWPCLYTLNIDDAIESNCPKYQVILPRKDFYQKYVEENNILYKIHGDVNYYLKYIEEEELIFNKKQYIDSLKSNKKMLSKFEDDFFNNNLIYIGCSLKEEPDLLSVIRSGDYNKIQKSSYYLSNNPLDDEDKDLLEDYGITSCVVVSNYDEFYKKIVELVSLHPVVNEEIIDRYREIEVVKLTKEQSDLSFLLKSDNLVPIPFERTLYKPYFFVNRTVTRGIISDLKIHSPLHIIYGHRISGKTYCLFDIHENVIDKERYFFPSNTQITDSMLDSLLAKRNTIILFDTQCLGVSQLNRIIDHKERLLEQGSYVVISINTSDRYSVDLLVENTDYKTTLLPNVFDKDEANEINSIFESTNMPLFLFVENKFDRVRNKIKKTYHTILDNLYKIAIEFGKKNHNFLLPDLSGITKGKDFSVILLLATQQAISSFEMFYYNLNMECHEFAERYPTLAEWVYNDQGVSRKDSRQKLQSNTRYYLLKILGDYSSDPKRHQIIVDGYKYLFRLISEAEDNKLQTTRKMLDFIKFDVINDIFYIKNNSAVKLIKFLYEELEDDMNFNPQFKHQRAKSILWLHEDDLQEIKTAVNYVDLAYYNTEMNLKRYHNRLLNISLGHIGYTRAILYGRLTCLENYTDINNVESAIKYYDTALFNSVNKNELEMLKVKKTDKRVYDDLNKLLLYVNNFENASGVIKLFARNLANKLGCFDDLG